jgi:hypothetical protein
MASEELERNGFTTEQEIRYQFLVGETEFQPQMTSCKIHGR